MGFGHRIYKNYDPRARIIKETADAVFEVTGRQPAPRRRARAREDRARGRVLRLAEAVPERRLLLGAHLRGARVAGCDVPGDVRHPADSWLARAMARGRRRPGAEDRAPAPAFRRRGRARLRPRRQPRPAGSSPCRQDRNGRAPPPCPPGSASRQVGLSRGRSAQAGQTFEPTPTPGWKLRLVTPTVERAGCQRFARPESGDEGEQRETRGRAATLSGHGRPAIGGTTDHWLMLGTGAVRSSGGGSCNPPLGVLREVRAARSGVEPRAYGPTLAPESHRTICARDPCGRARGSRNGNQ